MARPYHKQLISESHTRCNVYEAEMHAHKAAGKGNASLAFPGSPPPRRMLFLPGDTTAAALLGALVDNDGRGIICESEADTLTAAIGGEHGKFGDKLCKIFHHKPVPLIRKGGDLHLELERPAVSIVLTGTRAQLPRLMPTAENGLISRFLSYTYEQPYVWRSGAPGAHPSLESYFMNLGDELSSMIAATPGIDAEGVGGVEITLSSTDWQQLDEACQDGLQEAVCVAGGAGASSAFRLGPIVFRLIGVLTVLRSFENSEVPAGRVEADTRDVTAALRIMAVARAHALHVLATLPKSDYAKSAQIVSKRVIKAEKMQKALALREQGMSIRDIADEVGLPKSSVHVWFGTKVA
jgi:hypothetical protein